MEHINKIDVYTRGAYNFSKNQSILQPPPSHFFPLLFISLVVPVSMRETEAVALAHPLDLIRREGTAAAWRQPHI